MLHHLGGELDRARFERRQAIEPRHVQKELEGFLACGDPTNGFAWLHCAPCDHHRLVTFACKGRGFCPRCGGRRMAEPSAWWIDRVLPHVATRQWVLTVPPLRPIRAPSGGRARMKSPGPS